MQILSSRTKLNRVIGLLMTNFNLIPDISKVQVYQLQQKELA